VINETFEDQTLIPDQNKRFKVAVSADYPGNNAATAGVDSITLTGIPPPKASTSMEDVDLGAEQNWSDPAAWRFDPPRLP
jgi:hypothetical protein